MKRIKREALVNYSAEQMFAIVNDVESYPEFLPWCGGAKVLAASETEIVGQVVIEKLGIKQSFSTKNQLEKQADGTHKIAVELVDGPFSYLQGTWLFEPLGASACKVSFDIEFEVANALMNMVLGKVFEQIASTLVDSFKTRAVAKFGV